jgi:PadR family transcriptional regulator PadR
VPAYCRAGTADRRSRQDYSTLGGQSQPMATPCFRSLLSFSIGGTLLSVTEGSALSRPTDLVQGTLDLLILKVIALEAMHGWAIAQRIRQMSGEVLQVGQGALYPCLHKLEQNGWIRSEWAVSENNRRAKYYSLTRAGQKVLDREAAQWERLSAAISLVVRAV